MQFDVHMIGFDEMLAAAPSRPGAYALRQHDGLRFGRFRGDSDIVYIGCAVGPGGMKRRIQTYLAGSATGTTERVIAASAHYASFGEFEVAWVECADAEAARSLERDLLRRYELHHGEFPPLNRHG